MRAAAAAVWSQYPVLWGVCLHPINTFFTVILFSSKTNKEHYPNPEEERISLVHDGKMGSEPRGQQWMNIQTGRLCVRTVETHWHRAICLLSAPLLPPELPKLISRQHPKPITTSCFLQQSHQPSPRSRRCQSKVTSSFTVTVDLCLKAPLCPLLLCSAQERHAALKGVGVLSGIVCPGFYLEEPWTLKTSWRLKCLFTEVTTGINQCSNRHN